MTFVEPLLRARTRAIPAKYLLRGRTRSIGNPLIFLIDPSPMLVIAPLPARHALSKPRATSQSVTTRSNSSCSQRAQRR